MSFISPICRDKFTAQDFKFLCEVLVSRRQENQFMLRLLEDTEVRDTLLDNPRICRAISELNKSLYISCYFYFYILVRHALLRRSIDDRTLSDYIAMLLAESLQTHKIHNPEGNSVRPIIYLTDLIQEIGESGSIAQFYKKAFLGNYTLYLTGLFPQFLTRRQEAKAAPGVEYYETLGKVHFHELGEHRLAAKHRVNEVYRHLGECFTEVRLALNEMTSNYLHLHEAEEWKKVENLLRDIESID